MATPDDGSDKPSVLIIGGLGEADLELMVTVY
jgi:hypothetical protein